MSKSIAQKAVEAAVKAAGGSRRVVAKRLGVSSQAISQWDRVPPKHVLALEELSGISRYELRPDIYGPDPKRRRAEARQAA